MTTARWRRAEWALAALLALWVLVFTQLPTVWAVRSHLLGHQGPAAFTGILPTSAEDTATYFAWIRQAAEGRFFLEDRYTPEPHPRTYVNVLFWTLGLGVRASGLPVEVVYVAARVAFGVLLLVLLWKLARMAFVRPGERLACYVLLLVSGGWEGAAAWLERNAGGPHVSSPAWWMPELSTTFSLMLFPHFLAAFACMLGVLFLMLRAWPRQGWRAALAAGLLLAVLTFFHPYDALTLSGVLWGTPLLEAAVRRRPPWAGLRLSALATALWIPALAYNWLLFRSNPAMRAWDEQVVMGTPEVGRLVIAAGAGGVLALAGLLALPRLRRVHLAMVVWMVSALVLAFLPFRFQRRMLAGIQYPVAVLAVVALAYVVVPAALRAWKRLRGGREARIGRVGWGTLGVVLALFPLLGATPWYVQDIEWTRLRKARPPSWVRVETLAALRALDAHTGPGDLVLASRALGTLVPAMSGARCFVGHYGLTIDAEEKSSLAARFFAGGAEDEAWRRGLVDHFGITHVLHTPFERKDGGFDARASGWLREVAAFGEGPERAALYAVIAPARSPEATGVAGTPPASIRPTP